MLSVRSVRLDKTTEYKLEKISKETNKPKSFFIREAIKEYLEKFENKQINDKKKAIEFFINNPVDTKIKEIKAIQKVKSEKNIY